MPLAGLPLLTIFSVPLSMLGSGPAWYIFALTAGGFLTMLFIHEDEQVSRWGRSLDRETGGDAESFGVRTGAVRTNAGAIGGLVTALAIVVPLAIPTLDLAAFDFGPGSGGGGDINISNPMVDLRRDLIQGEDNDLVTVVTDDPDPSYLRIAVLNRFSSDAWSSGDRDVPSSQQASGNMPPLEGVDPSVSRQEFDYAAQRDQLLQVPVAARRVQHQQHRRVRRLALRRRHPGLPRQRRRRRARPRPASTGRSPVSSSTSTPTGWRSATSSAGLVDEEFTNLPEGLDNIVRRARRRGHRRRPRPASRRPWPCRTGSARGGGFVYDDSQVGSNGADDLARFLREGPGGRTGYCEQFAASMAVMARILGIPSRVAVGFLHPDQVARNTFVYSAHDLHAWPELYINGAGWVRFEPTPGGRAETVPGYTDQERRPGRGSRPTTPPRTRSATPSAAPSETATADPQDDEASAASGSGFPWLRIAVVLLALALLVSLLLAPRSLRRNRRAARLAGGPEDVWLELRDTVRDLGLLWPRSRSPRQTADVLVRWFGAPPDEFTPERPRRGPDTNPVAVEALERIVLALELSRYAEREPGPDGSWSADVEHCVLALTGGTTARVRRRAEWWPRSLFTRERAVSRPSGPDDDSQRPALRRGRRPRRLMLPGLDPSGQVRAPEPAECQRAPTRRFCLRGRFAPARQYRRRRGRHAASALKRVSEPAGLRGACASALPSAP